MTDDVSNKTVLVLVILTILISTLGTFTVTSSVRNYQNSQVPVYDSGSNVQSGEVSLVINNPSESEIKSATAPPVTGNVALNIVSRG